MKNIINHKTSYIFIILSAVFVLTAGVVQAAVPDGFVVETVTSGLSLPTSVAITPDGEYLIAEKSGTVRVFHDGTLHTTPFITLTDINDYADHGLLGIAVDPNFAVNNFVYLLYTYENTPGVNYEGPKTARLVRVTANGDIAVPGSEVVILGSVGGDIDSPSCEDFPVTADCIASDGTSHTIADVSFGPDGKLYVSIGDAASFDIVDPLALRALDLNSLNGKVLRINSDGTAPSDNPFYNGDPTANISKVWNYGLRNPFRFNFRPSNGSLYIGDVGWFSWEEINIGVAGANFGWPCREGLVATPGYNCTTENFVDGLYIYGHGTSGAGSVTGGVFYDDNIYPTEYKDTYFFGDFAQDWIKRIVVDANDNIISVEDFMDSAGGPVEFFTDAEGNVNYLSIYTGELRRITFTAGNRNPIAEINATPISGLSPLEVTFSSASSTDPDGDPITFLWDFGDGATSTDASPVHTYTVNDTYTVRLDVADNKGGLGTDTISIIVGNISPTATILTPPNGSLYSAGQIIPLSGGGIDPEDGVLPESAYSWQVFLHHNIHLHILATLVGSNPSFIAPDHAHDPEIFVEVELTVTDSVGLTDTTSINLYKAPITEIDPFHLQTSMLPVSPLVNESLTITSVVGNNGTSGPVLIDIELFDSAGTKIAQAFYDNETLETGQTASYTLDWTPIVGGDYRVAVGLLHPNWNGLYEWTNEALQFTIVDSWTPISPNGALDFDGVDDYVNTEAWDIGELAGFTLESRFVADSFSGDTFFIAKSTGTSTIDYDWAFGLREISPTQAELLYILRTDEILTELTGGTVSIGELVHASAVYDNSTMEIYKNGVSVASIAKTGLISTSTNFVWLGSVPDDPTSGAFDGMFDEVRVWSEPQSSAEIVQFQGELTQKEFGLIKDWRFNEGFGQFLIDSSNSGHHGRLGSTMSTDANDPVFVAGEYSSGGTFSPTHITTTAIPNPVATGVQTDITTTIQNTGDGAGFMIVDIEVYDATGTQVYQQIFDGEGFAPTETRNFTAGWTPSTEGEYRVEIGLVQLYWEGVYEWTGDATTITVTDSATNTAPVITILGDNPLALNLGDAFVDPGATASDTEDGDITGSIIIGGDTVDTSVVGSYSITYNVTDSDGLSATEATRTVTVVDTVPSPSKQIYLDALESGWVSWSWDTVLDFSHATTVFEGANSIESTCTAMWGGVYLHNDAVDTTGYTSLSFAISGGTTGGQGLQIRPYDAANAELPALSLASYITGGTPPLGSWENISIPLTDLGITETIFTGFVIQGNTGSVEATFYLDDIRLD